MTDDTRGYLSYLLRLWQTQANGEQIWRASLEIPGTGERQGFASIKILFDFIAAQTSQVIVCDEQGADPDDAKEL